MPSFDSYRKSSKKIIYLGDCLSGDTIVHAKRKGKVKQLSIATLFKMVDKPLRYFGPTSLLAEAEGSVATFEMKEIVKSGVKPLFRIQTDERTIKASQDHLFKTPNGWARLQNLKKGDALITWRTTRDKFQLTDKSKKNKGRAYTYSIPYHPFGIQNWVAGRDYKRYPTSRLVVEAALNGLSLINLIKILRNEPETAMTLQYLSKAVDVHHLNGDKTDDRLENLQVIDRFDHMLEHQSDKIKASKSTEISKIVEITEIKEEATYDIVMASNPHNFIANGFVVHNSGAGKTGSLAALAAAGYNVRILDFDDKAEILKGFLFDKERSIYRRARPGLWTQQQADTVMDRMRFVTMTEHLTIKGSRAVPRGDLWVRAMNQLNNWTDGDDKPGNVAKWPSTDILVIDSFSRFCEAAMNYHLSLNNRLLEGPRTGTSSNNDYNAIYKYIMEFINYIKSDEIKCSVIIIGHIVFMERAGAQTTVTKESKGFLQVFGKAMISPVISQHFPHVIRAKSTGIEPSVKHIILTNNDENVELITPAPLRVRKEYPLETGLAEYFHDVDDTTTIN